MKRFDQGGVSAGAPADSQDTSSPPSQSDLDAAIRTIQAMGGLGLDLGSLFDRPETQARISPNYTPGGGSVRQGSRSPFVAMGEADPAVRPAGSVMNTRMPYQPPGYTNYAIDERIPRVQYDTGFMKDRISTNPYPGGTRIAMDYLQERSQFPTSLTGMLTRNFANYLPAFTQQVQNFAPAYTGYNPFAAGQNVNPYAQLMARQQVNPLMSMQPQAPRNPFMYMPRQPMMPAAAAAPAASVSRPAQTVFQGARMKQGGPVDEGIAAVRFKR